MFDAAIDQGLLRGIRFGRVGRFPGPAQPWRRSLRQVPAKRSEQQKPGPDKHRVPRQAQAQEMQFRLGRMGKFEQADHAQDEQQCGQPGQQIRQRQGMQSAAQPGKPVHHDEAGESARQEQHRQQEHDAEVKQEKLGVIAQQEVHQRQDDRADDGPDEEAESADIGHQQHPARGHEVQILIGEELVVEREQAAGHAGEQARRAERDEAHPARAIADEFGAFGIVAHGVGHAPGRRLGEQVHEQGRNEDPEGREIVDVDIAEEIHPEKRRAEGAVAAHPGFAAEKAGKDQRGGRHEFAYSQRDHGKHRTRLARRETADEDAREQAGQAADERDEGDREIDGFVLHHQQRMHGEKAAQAEIDRMTEREHAALAEQHVVTEREHDGDGHLVEDRDRQDGIEQLRQQ